MKNKPVRKSLPTDPASQTMKVVERCYRGFFGLLKKKQRGNYNRPVEKPHFLPKNGHFLCIFPQRKNQCKKHFSVVVPKDLQEKYKFKKFIYPIPPNVEGHQVKEVRILPRCRATYFEIEFVYEVKPQPQALNKRRVLSIDPGVSNFATCLDSETGRSFILDGRKMKSINQWYNKERARLQAVLEKQGRKTSKRLQVIAHKRGRRMQEFLNQYANLVIQVCLTNKIGKLVMGEGWRAQEGANCGDANNQNFVMLPFGKFAWKLRAKCEFNGIEFSTVDEAYTSKCDHLANESMCHHEKYAGNRTKRGLFKSSTGVTLNADVNGALGIMLKSGMGKGLRIRLSRGVVNTPLRIRPDQIRQTSPKRLSSALLGSAQTSPSLTDK